MKKPCCRMFHGSLSRPNRGGFTLCSSGPSGISTCGAVPGECVTPKLERMEFETREDAKLYAAPKGYEWEKDLLAPGC